MTRSTRADDDMHDLDADLKALAARYDADSSGLEPPRHLDARLLAAAHRAANAKPRASSAAVSPASSLMRRMRAPFGLAASIVAVASITVALWKEAPDKLAIPSDHAPDVASNNAAAAKHFDNSSAQVVPVLPAASVAPSPAPTASARSSAPPPRAQQAREPSGILQSRHESTVAPPPPALVSKSAQFNQATPAVAAPAAPLESNVADQSLDRITVTGSTLKRADTNSSPIQKVDPSAHQSTAQNAPATSPAALGGLRTLQAARPSADDISASSPSQALLAAEQARPLASAAASAPPSKIAEKKTPAAKDQGRETLLSALQNAVDAGDSAAARLVLETLEKNYPHVAIPSKLRIELHALGIALPD